MKPFLILALLMLSSTISWGNDRAIKAMARASGYSEKEIRAEIAKGCDGTGDMALCAWYRYYMKDVALNDTYRDLMHRLSSASSREELRKSQKAWIDFRFAQCLFSTGGWAPGSFRKVDIAMCWESMTENREKELAEVLKCNQEQGCLDLKDASTDQPSR